jgi:2-keto-3-deoxygluconate permease
MIPFSALALGSELDPARVWHARLLDDSLGVAVLLLFTGIPLFLADRVTGGGVSGVAAASIAGNAAAVPAVVAAANRACAEAAAHTVILGAAAVIVTAVLLSLLTAWIAKAVGAWPDLPTATITAPAE